MHVIATAGHVDHGKSTLVRALTGMEPDRWAEERRRGMTLDLGFAWTDLPSGETIAFVDVPGHERFVPTMLAGVGPVPAILVVVAADEGWMPQTEEHVAAAAALATPRVVLAVTKCDLADPDPVCRDAVQRLRSAGFGTVPVVRVSGATGAGLAELSAALDDLVRSLPAPRLEGPVRLWVDRAFTIRGTGTVVTGTLGAGAIRVGDTLDLAPSGRRVTVRGLQSLQRSHPEVRAISRVAVSLRGVDRDEIGRGDALVTPGAWSMGDTLDVLLAADAAVPEQVVVHAGAAAVAARSRRLGPRAVRLRLSSPLPLHLDDRLLLRDPGSRRIAAADVADLAPAPLRRRGDAARVAAALRVPATADEEIARRGVAGAEELRRQGFARDPQQARRCGRWWVDPEVWTRLSRAVAERVELLPPLSAGIPIEELRRGLELPDAAIVVAVVEDVPGCAVVDGRVARAGAAPPGPADLPELAPLLARLSTDPLAAPDAVALTASGVSAAQLSAAVRAGLLLRVAEGVYVAPDAPRHALQALRRLPQPFSVAAARDALGASRRVVVPVLEHLDALRATRRLPDGTRLVVRSTPVGWEA